MSETKSQENIYVNIDWFHSTFLKTSLTDFRRYLAVFKELKVSKWLIFSDYCFDDPNKLYDALTFTIVPYVNDFNELQQYIKNLAPKDLKKTKEVKPEFCEFIKSGYTFNITVILNKNNKKFLPLNADNAIKEIETLQNIFESWIINKPINKEYYKTV